MPQKKLIACQKVVITRFIIYVKVNNSLYIYKCQMSMDNHVVSMRARCTDFLTGGSVLHMVVDNIDAKTLRARDQTLMLDLDL